MGGIKHPHAVDLTERQQDYLQRMAETHNLPDLAKVIRCLVDHAAANPDREEEIFTVIRCEDC